MDTEGRTRDTLFHQLWHSDGIDEGMFRQHNVHHTREIEDEHVLPLLETYKFI